VICAFARQTAEIHEAAPALPALEAAFLEPFQKRMRLNGWLSCDLIAEALHVFNRTNVGSVNPDSLHAGEPLSALDPRQIQFGVRLSF
jgi:hypothetical protein